MKTESIKITQNDINLYIFVLKAKDIYDKFDVSRRIEDKEKWYQRSFSKIKINDVKKYISQENWLIPNSILVSLDDWKFKYENNSITFNEENSLWLIIDWQHRVKGAYEANENFPLFIVWVEWLDVRNQAKLFIKVNKTQKWVPVSLYLDLLDITDWVIEDFDDEDISSERRAIEISKRLNEEDDSPLNWLIRMTWESWRGIALSESTSKIKKYVDPNNWYFSQYWFEDQYRIFKIYFKAIKSVFIEDWNDNNSLILKTVWFWGFMFALNDIVWLVEDKFNVENVIKLLKNIENFKLDSNKLWAWIKWQQNASNYILSEIRKGLKDWGNSLTIED